LTQKIIKRIIFVLFLLQKVKFEEIRKIVHIYSYIHRSLYIIICEQFFLIFFNLTFCKRNNAKIKFLFFHYYYFFIVSKMNMYGHILYIIIYVFIYEKYFLPVNMIVSTELIIRENITEINYY